MKNCTVCDQKLNKQNISGLCRKHKHLSPSYREGAKKYAQNNKELIAQKAARFWAKHRDRLLAEKRAKRKLNPEKTRLENEKYRNRPDYKEKRKKYDLKNRENFNQQQKERRKTDPVFKLRKTLRTRLLMAIDKNYKSGSAVRDLGCTIEELKKYLERKFESGMSWENHGRGLSKWNIDHIIPLTKFDLTNKEELLKAVHYTNLQPLWFMENIKKGNRL